MILDPLLDRPLPAWYDDAKFGLFVHWTAAAVPAYAPIPEVWPLPADDPRAWTHSPYAEGYQDTLAIAGSPTALHHAEHYGDAPYDAFVSQFREGLASWNPQWWADLCEVTGARYLVLTTKIEDGFLLWPSDLPNPHRRDWQSQRDLVGELASALDARGVRLGLYYSGLDFPFSPDGPGATSLEQMMARYPRTKQYAGYVEGHWRELIERYRPAILWSDFGYPQDAETSADDLFRWYFERVPDGVVNDRFDEMRTDGGTSYSDFRTYEFKLDFTRVVDRKWEACRPIGLSFGYNRDEGGTTYQSTADLIHSLVDIVARGGNLLLGLGPTAQGAPPWLQAERLVGVGWWLRRYGSAIYGTRRWERPTGSTADGVPIRYTATDDAVYAIVLGTPNDARVELDVRLDDNAEVAMCDRQGRCSWSHTTDGITIDLPERPDAQPAFALRLAPRDLVHGR